MAYIEVDKISESMSMPLRKCLKVFSPSFSKKKKEKKKISPFVIR